MRIIVSSVPRAVALAKSLRALLAGEGLDVSLSEAKSHVAAILGYEDWAELRLVTERGGRAPSAFDDADLASERRRYQARRLGAATGLPDERTGPVVDALGACSPPARRWKPTPATDAVEPPMPFDQALRPREWLALHRIPVAGTYFPAGPASEAFAGQLGRLWTGTEGLRRHERVLVATLGLMLAGLRAGVARLLDVQMLATLPSRAPEVDRLVEDALRTPAVKAAVEAVAGRHAFVTTVLCGLLAEARRHGVVASTEFTWLKGVDRTLWYALNSLGRRGFHVEAAGIGAHMRAEAAAGGPLPTARVAGALGGIEDYLATHGEGDEEPLPRRVLRLRANHFVELRAHAA